MIKDKYGNTWFKGNLHTHTTKSDGHLSPDEVIRLYKENGYDFMAITDHNIFSEESLRDDFLIISGAEYDTGRNAKEGIYHIVGLGMTKAPDISELPQKPPVQEIINEVKKADGFAVLAHPAWSMNKVDEIIKLSGIDATEIYNTVSGLPYSTRPHSGDIIDRLALEGYFLPCIAVDDTHYYKGDECVSYIMVKAEELSTKAILAAIKKGDFYATQGPDFEITIDKDMLKVSCSEAKYVFFNSNAVWTPDRVTRGENITEAFYQIKPYDRFVRVEIIDNNDKMAWSSAIKVK